MTIWKQFDLKKNLSSKGRTTLEDIVKLRPPVCLSNVNNLNTPLITARKQYKFF